MDKKISDTVNNICTILGGALILYPLIDEATKTLIPEMQKLASGETLQELKMLPDKQEKQQRDEQEQYEQSEQYKHDDKYKQKDNEISELKKKIAEYESEKEKQKSYN